MTVKGSIKCASRMHNSGVMTAHEVFIINSK